MLASLDPRYKEKRRLLQELADYLNGAMSSRGPFRGRTPFPTLDALRPPRTVIGPRVGELRVYVGAHAERLHRTLTKSGLANTRAIFSEVGAWDLEGRDPEVVWDGDALVLRATWPDALQFNDIPLRVAGRVSGMHPSSGRALIVGLSHTEVVAVALDDTAPHALIGGITGSGKSWLLNSIGYQLSQDPRARFVLLDGKGGQGIGNLNGLHGQVGPVARTDEAQLNALCWTLREVNRRNEALGDAALGNGDVTDFGPIYVIYDEFQALLSSNRDAADIVRVLAQEARSANVHLVFATQRPREDMWGGTGAKFQFDIRIALQLDEYGSRMVLGSGHSMSATGLLGSGDAIVAANIENCATRIRRVQCCYVPSEQIRERTRDENGNPRHELKFTRWPDFDAGQFREDARGARAQPFTREELAVAVHIACEGHGFPTAMDDMEAALGYRMGSGRFERLKEAGADMLAVMSKLEEDKS